jgi:sialate O-acetylesterase
MEPARASVYGYIGNASQRGAKVSVTIAESSDNSSAYSVDATVDATTGTWKAFLMPTAAGGSYTVTATCTAGCTGTEQIDDVTFGNVWYCFGQSNMALPVQFTYARNDTITQIKNKAFGNDIRLTGLKGNMNADQPWITISDAVGGFNNKTMPHYGEAALDHFSSTCLYFGTSLYEGQQKLSDSGAAPIGLVHTAWGGSMIENWLTNEEIATCKGAAIDDRNEVLFDTATRPYLDMTLKGWVYYQGEVRLALEIV